MSDLVWRSPVVYIVYMHLDRRKKKIEKMHVYKELQSHIIWRLGVCMCEYHDASERILNAGLTLASSGYVVVNDDEEEEEKKGSTRKYLLSCGLRTGRHGRGRK